MKELDNRILSIFSLLLNKNTHGNQDILNLYHAIDDWDVFLKIMGLFSGRTVKFPTLAEIEDSLLTALIYFYRESGYTWEEIRAIVPEDFSPAGYSMKLKSLNSFILKSISKIMKEEQNGKQGFTNSRTPTSSSN